VNGGTLISVALLLPLAGALGIALAGRLSDNLRETVTLVTAGALAVTVWMLFPEVLEGGRPAMTFGTVVPGIDIAFSVEPLGMKRRTRRDRKSPLW